MVLEEHGMRVGGGGGMYKKGSGVWGGGANWVTGEEVAGVK